MRKALLPLLLALASCKSPAPTPPAASAPAATALPALPGSPGTHPLEQIDDYIVSLMQDSRGRIWMGTVLSGAAQWDGIKLTYHRPEHGMPDLTVPCVMEDRQGNIWFGTHNGAARWDGQQLTTFQAKEGLPGSGCHLFQDSKGTLWAGSADGVFRFQDGRFEPFELPTPKLKEYTYMVGLGKSWDFLEDRKGNLWFARDGYGVCRYDGTSFMHLTMADGLPSNSVATMLEDSEGNLWLGCIGQNHPVPKPGVGGVARYDGKRITTFADVDGLLGREVYFMMKERSGALWMCPVGLGAYRYDGKTFTLYHEVDRPDLIQNFAIQSGLEDREGQLWFGFSGGLFKWNGGKFLNVTQGGIGK